MKSCSRCEVMSEMHIKCTLKPWWDSIAHQFEWLKLKRWTIPSDAEDGKQPELWWTAGRNVKQYHHCGDLAVSQLPYKPAPRNLSKKNQNPCLPQKSGLRYS